MKPKYLNKMRLKSLYINEYKNIKDQTFDFSNNTGYIALIGENGSGKSNLLEAISIIIKGLLNGGRGISFDYSIKYEIDGIEYERSKGKSLKNGLPIKERDMQYPSSLIACYSGEELRLWHNVYEDYHMHYFNKAVSESYYAPVMLYINRYCWEIALISLLCASEKPDINEFLTSCLNINDISNVIISFSHDEDKQGLFKEHDALKWYRRVISDGCENINAKTLSTMDILATNTITQKQEKCKTIFQYLYLLSQPKRNGINKIDKLINRISIKIGDINFENLSEGEKKLILIECIVKVLGDKNTIILLDEPDAHIHIVRKKELLRIIESFEGQTLMTTHSPIFANEIHKTNKDNLLLLKDGKQLSTSIVDKLTELSGNEIDFISGSLIVGSKKILVVEGISDIRSIKKAIDVYVCKNPKYKKLHEVQFISAGGTGDVKEIVTEVLFNQIEHIEQIVFAFDIDDAGKKGYKKIDELKKDEIYKPYSSKIKAIYYKNDISANFELEDLFPHEVYGHIITNLHKLKTYRDFKTNTQSTVSRIKDYIKDNVSSFDEAQFGNFGPLLDRLLTEFELV